MRRVREASQAATQVAPTNPHSLPPPSPPPSPPPRRYYQGVISRDNRDGTYDIDYDDGEKEKGVKESYIRKISGGGGLKHSPRGGKSSSSRNDNIDDDGNLSRGDKIEARYRGGSKYYPGKIARDNRDGTYDIDYDDGEKERGVKKSYIKR